KSHTGTQSCKRSLNLSIRSIIHPETLSASLSTECPMRTFQLCLQVPGRQDHCMQPSSASHTARQSSADCTAFFWKSVHSAHSIHFSSLVRASRSSSSWGRTWLGFLNVRSWDRLSQLRSSVCSRG